jgi:hypothetical protein
MGSGVAQGRVVNSGNQVRVEALWGELSAKDMLAVPAGRMLAIPGTILEPGCLSINCTVPMWVYGRCWDGEGRPKCLCPQVSLVEAFSSALGVGKNMLGTFPPLLCFL